jgi:CheY-like chemotaxis protein
VVDDEPIHRGLLADLLNPLGFLTLEAQDADSCLALLNEAQPDLFLLDVNMPGRDGLTLAAALRELGWQRPIVMVSADAQQPLQRGTGKSVFDDYLVKPINHQTLVDRIGHLLGLEWVYADDPPSPKAAVGQGPPSLGPKLQITLPDHALLRELLAHAQIGYRAGVQTKLDEIATVDNLVDMDTLTAFRELADRMQFDQLATSLERSLT